MLPDGIAILGSGLPAWLAADVLSRALGRGAVAIAVHEGPDTCAGADVLSPRAIELANQLGCSEAFLLGAGRGVPVLGTVIERADAAPQFFGFAPAGVPLGPIAFHQIAARLRGEGEAVTLANFNFNALCAQTGRYAPPAPGEAGVAAAIEAGLSVDAAALAAVLRDNAMTRGVACSADLATTPRSLVLDCRIAGSANATRRDLNGQPPPLYALLRAEAKGWQRCVPLARAICEQKAPPDFAGADRPAWRDGVIDLGLAWRGVDPQAGLALHLFLSQLNRLLGLLPAGSQHASEATEFNRLTGAEMDAARDWAAALLSPQRAGSERLEMKRRVYADCGRVPMFDEEPAEEADWIALFDVVGIVPHHWDAQLNGVPSAALTAHCAKIREVMIAGLRAMPVYHGPAGTVR